jgi:hypothetical protein
MTSSSSKKPSLLTDEDIYKIQQQILKDQAKKKKYKRQGKNINFII